MDWSSFPGDLAASLLGTMFGIEIGLRIDHRQTRRNSLDHDERLVQSLIELLASKRAFSHPSDVGLVDNDDDRQRCIQSILDARRRIAGVCDALRVREDVAPQLRDLESDCIAYLYYVEEY